MRLPPDDDTAMDPRVAIVAVTPPTRAVALIEKIWRSDPRWRIDPFSTDPPPSLPFGTVVWRERRISGGTTRTRHAVAF